MPRNNYATAYYTKSSSPLDIILQREGLFGAVSASWEWEFLCLREQKKKKNSLKIAFSLADTVTAVCHLTTPISRSALVEMSLAAWLPLRRQNCCFYGCAVMNLQQLNLHLKRCRARLVCEAATCSGPTMHAEEGNLFFSVWKHVGVSVAQWNHTKMLKLEANTGVAAVLMCLIHAWTSFVAWVLFRICQVLGEIKSTWWQVLSKIKKQKQKQMYVYYQTQFAYKLENMWHHC